VSAPITNPPVPKAPTSVGKPAQTETKQLPSRYKALEICKKKYPEEFQRKRIFTLALAVISISALIIGGLALAFSSLGVLSFGVAILAITPIALLATSLLVKRIDKVTDYWTLDLAEKLLKAKTEEEEKKAKKLAASIKAAPT
jgi:hypothetical protein